MQYHRDLGHMRGRNLFTIMKLKVWWPSLSKDINSLLDGCLVCKQHCSLPWPQKSVLPVSSGANFEHWALDIVGPMPEIPGSDKRYIITAIDYVTCWPVAWATSNRGTGSSPCELVYGVPPKVTYVNTGTTKKPNWVIRLDVPNELPLEPTPTLAAWRDQATTNKAKQI